MERLAQRNKSINFLGVLFNYSSGNLAFTFLIAAGSYVSQPHKSEAIALFNTKSATVKNCRITTKTPKSRNSYSVGLAVAYQKGSAPKATTKNVISLTNNTVKGGQQGIFVRSNASKKLGTVIVSGNTVSAKKGKKNAIKVLSAKKVKITKNKTKKW